MVCIFGINDDAITEKSGTVITFLLLSSSYCFRELSDGFTKLED